MVGAVGEVDGDIDHGEAERAGFQIVAHAGFDRLDIGLRHDATGDGVSLNWKPETARQRLDLDHNVAELAMSTRLLLVAAALLHRSCGSSRDRGTAGAWPSTGIWFLPSSRSRTTPQMHLAMPRQHGFGRGPDCGAG